MGKYVFYVKMIFLLENDYIVKMFCFVKKCFVLLKNVFFVRKCFVGKCFVNKCFLLNNVFPK